MYCSSTFFRCHRTKERKGERQKSVCIPLWWSNFTWKNIEKWKRRYGMVWRLHFIAALSNCNRIHWVAVSSHVWLCVCAVAKIKNSIGQKIVHRLHFTSGLRSFPRAQPFSKPIHLNSFRWNENRFHFTNISVYTCWSIDDRTKFQRHIMLLSSPKNTAIRFN